MSKYKLNPGQEAWVQALESGEYKQAPHMLCQRDAHQPKAPKMYCCLGVACELVKEQLGLRVGADTEVVFFDDCDLTMPQCVTEHYGFYDEVGGARPKIIINSRRFEALSAANDAGVSFADIAAFIRDNPEVIFKTDTLIHE